MNLDSSFEISNVKTLFHDLLQRPFVVDVAELWTVQFQDRASLNPRHGQVYVAVFFLLLPRYGLLL